MKNNFGILAQLPFILAVIFLFPLFGTMGISDTSVKVDWTFYLWQIILAVCVILEHFWFEKFQESYEGNAQGIIFLFYTATFVLTILNLSRFQ